MVALPLLDIVLASDQRFERSARLAAQLVQASIAELDGIEALDDSVAPENPGEFDRPTASLLRGMYERWADEAEHLLERIDLLKQQNAIAVPQTDRLRDAHGKTRARLSISLDDMERGIREAAQGDTVPLEEVRRDLRLRVQQAGNGPVSSTRPLAGGGGS